MRGEVISEADVNAALRLLEDFRAAHQPSLTTATMGLRSMVRREGCRMRVSQRLKRRGTILDKLTREPTLPLASMQDIAGCRAVLDTVDEIRRVERRLQGNRWRRPIVNVADYVTNPRPSGYRGMHIIVNYHDRMIEVQLRTLVMHTWAIAVEQYGGRLHEDLKSSRGPAEVLEWLEAVSRAMAVEEEDGAVEPALLAEITTLRQRALPFLGGAFQ